MMDAKTRAAFEAHIARLLALAEAGDEMAVKSLACMALLVDAPAPPDGGGQTNVIDLRDYRTRLAA